MFHRWAALLLVLALCAMSPKTAAGQSQSKPRGQGASGLGSYPNPFNPQTWIPFGVGDPPACTDNGKQYRVSLKIYNLLSQLVAIPLLQGPGIALDNVTVSCGEYTAFWDGKVLNTGREAASGVYYYKLEVNGVPLLKRMIVVK